MTTLKRLYDKLEDDNQHGLASVVAACAGRDAFAVTKLVKIMQTHKRVGWMATGDYEERGKIARPFYPALRKNETIAEVTRENTHLGEILAAVVAYNTVEVINLGLGW